jgi:hypothetical protein
MDGRSLKHLNQGALVRPFSGGHFVQTRPFNEVVAAVNQGYLDIGSSFGFTGQANGRHDPRIAAAERPTFPWLWLTWLF